MKMTSLCQLSSSNLARWRHAELIAESGAVATSSYCWHLGHRQLCHLWQRPCRHLRNHHPLRPLRESSRPPSGLDYSDGAHCHPAWVARCSSPDPSVASANLPSFPASSLRCHHYCGYSLCFGACLQSFAGLIECLGAAQAAAESTRSTLFCESILSEISISSFI